MKRAFGFFACLGGMTFALALAVSPEAIVNAAPAASASASTSSTAPPQSVYISRAGAGVILPPSIDDAEAFCALVLACRDVPMYPPAPDFQGCVRALMSQLTGPDALTASLSIRECGLSATSCSKLRQCALKGANATACDGVALEGDKPIGKCDMDARAITCWRGKVLGVRNCGLADELCVAKGGKAECALAGACPANAKDEWTCAGNRMVKCQDNKFLSIDCNVLNLSCVTDNGKANCAPAKTAACKGNAISCKGTDSVACVNGKEVKVDCGQQGMSCHDPSKTADDRTVGLCEMPAPTKKEDACDPAKFESKCDGATIKYCASGTIHSYQCKSIGATKCVMDKGTGPRCTA
jgi:hypothetical protein